MQTKASVLGTPVHPALVHFPLGLWLTSFVTDVLFYLTRNSSLLLVSKFLIAAGLIGGIAAAIPGFIDWWTLKDGPLKRIADWHARLNFIALALFAGSLYLRIKHLGAPLVNYRIRIPFLVSLIGVVLVGIAANLGGEMVYKHRMGVAEELRNQR
jgi:uncharacterized membrane protein